MLDTTTQFNPATMPDTAAAPAPAAAAVEKKPRATNVIDVSAGTMTATDGGNAAVFHLAEVPAALHPYLALAGLRASLRQAAKPAEMWADFKAGKMPGRGPGRPREMSANRKAIAHAKVEATKKTDAPMTLDAALAWARGLDRTEVDARMKHPLVVKHFHKLAGTEPVL